MTILNNCKLTYFGLPGRGEATRLALSIGKIPFEDCRVEFKDWKELKSKTPWGNLPYLTLTDGTMIGQNRAILRLVGKETNLYPTDSKAAALVDSLMDAGEDLAPQTMKVGAGLEAAEKEAARAKACEAGGILYGTLEKLDTFVATHGKNGHAVGETITIADLYLYALLGMFLSGIYDGIPPTAIDGFVHLLALRKLVRSHPDVTKWYDELSDEIKAKLSPAYGPID